MNDLDFFGYPEAHTWAYDRQIARSGCIHRAGLPLLGIRRIRVCHCVLWPESAIISKIV